MAKNIGKRNVRDFTACFLLEVLWFQVLHLYLMYFEFILVYGVRRWSSLIVFQVPVQFFQPQLLNRLSLPHCMFLSSLSYVDYDIGTGLSLGYFFSSIDQHVFF